METWEENLNETLKADSQTLQADNSGKKKCYISLPISRRDMKRVRLDIKMMEHELRAIGYEPNAPINDDTDMMKVKNTQRTVRMNFLKNLTKRFDYD